MSKAVQALVALSSIASISIAISLISSLWVSIVISAIAIGVALALSHTIFVRIFKALVFFIVFYTLSSLAIQFLVLNYIEFTKTIEVALKMLSITSIAMIIISRAPIYALIRGRNALSSALLYTYIAIRLINTLYRDLPELSYTIRVNYSEGNNARSRVLHHLSLLKCLALNAISKAIHYYESILSRIPRIDRGYTDESCCLRR